MANIFIIKASELTKHDVWCPHTILMNRRKPRILRSLADCILDKAKPTKESQMSGDLKDIALMEGKVGIEVRVGFPTSVSFDDICGRYERFCADAGVPRMENGVFFSSIDDGRVIAKFRFGIPGYDKADDGWYEEEQKLREEYRAAWDAKKAKAKADAEKRREGYGEKDAILVCARSGKDVYLQTRVGDAWRLSDTETFDKVEDGRKWCEANGYALREIVLADGNVEVL